MAGLVRRAGTRARQRDRDDVLDALSAAYADGQLDDEEHERRVAATIRAEQLPELVALIDDLQLADGPANDLVTSAHAEPAPTPRWKWVARGLGAVAVVVVVVTVIVVWVDEAGSPERLDMRTETNLARMVDAVEDEFGSTEVVGAGIGETRTGITVPVGQGRSETWFFSINGLEKYDAGRGRVPRGTELVDLADLDVDRLLANLEAAEDGLGIDEVHDSGIEIEPGPLPSTVADSAAGRTVDGHVQIRVSSPYQENAFLYTDLAGNVLERVPFRAQ